MPRIIEPIIVRNIQSTSATHMSDLRFEEGVLRRTARDHARKARYALDCGDLDTWDLERRRSVRSGTQARMLRFRYGIKAKNRDHCTPWAARPY